MAGPATTAKPGQHATKPWMETTAKMEEHPSEPQVPAGAFAPVDTQEPTAKLLVSVPLPLMELLVTRMEVLQLEI